MALQKMIYQTLGPRASRPHDSAPHKLWHSRGYLPHYDQPGLIQSITFHLADSVPAHVIKQWRIQLSMKGGEAATDPRAVELRRRIERYADLGSGACWLRIPMIAHLVEQALFHFDAERYRLLAWCVMPNHVHSLLETFEGFPLDNIIHSWKSYTAKECNRLLKRTGQFWLPDYFDRYIRDINHLVKGIHYIEHNPVKAGLCQKPEDWPWSSARMREKPEIDEVNVRE